jgi:nucleotide-binding universal stress UspA family protein
MERGLVVLGGTKSSGRLLREAAEHASGANAELILLSTFTRQQYEHDLEILDRIARSEFTLAGEKDEAELATELGEWMARELLEEFDVEYRVVGALVDDGLGRRIVSEAEDRECDHVFLTSKRKSRLGGVLGDAARRVLRTYDGITTIAYERDPEQRLLRLRGESYDDYEASWLGSDWE